MKFAWSFLQGNLSCVAATHTMDVVPIEKASILAKRHSREMVVLFSFFSMAIMYIQYVYTYIHIYI